MRKKKDSITSVNRNILTQGDIEERDSFLDVNHTLATFQAIKKCSCKKFLLETFPFVVWMSEYKIKRDLPMDIIAGMTVTVLQIPQGLAYAFLANVPPICGLYTAFFTSFVYVFFGTSRHTNFGTFAVVCLMVGQIVTKHSTLDEDGKELDNRGPILKTGDNFKNLEVLCAVTFTVAIYMLVMYCLRLGIITAILSETLVNAFTSACAIHVITAQFKEMFGLTFKSRTGDYFRIGFTLYDIATNIKDTNYMSLGVALSTMTSLIIYYETMKPRLARKCRAPIPVELLIVTIAVLCSYLFDLEKNFEVSIIGHIPSGLPYPEVPRIEELFPKVAFECLPVALVSYIITMSLGIIFGRKGSYEVSANQELLALGLMNLAGSFFSCIAVSGSLSRSIIQYNVGGVSQLALLFSALFILFILLYAGPLLVLLPKSVLGGIIIATIYTMLFQVRKLKTFWLLSKWDTMIWLVTFCATLVVDIKYGLLSGMAVAIMVICYHFCSPTSYVLGVVPGTEIYMSERRYKNIKETVGLKIFRYEGGINFATTNVFRDHLTAQSGVNAKQLIIERKRAFRKLQSGGMLPPLELEVKCIILDFSALTHIDPAGVCCLHDIENDYSEIGITILFASASGEICAKVKNYDRVENLDHVFTIFVTIHDAVMFAKQYILFYHHA